jgi:hypothetical protein
MYGGRYSEKVFGFYHVRCSEKNDDVGDLGLRCAYVVICADQILSKSPNHQFTTQQPSSVLLTPRDATKDAKNIEDSTLGNRTLVASVLFMLVVAKSGY